MVVSFNHKFINLKTPEPRLRGSQPDVLSYEKGRLVVLSEAGRPVILLTTHKVGQGHFLTLKPVSRSYSPWNLQPTTL